MVAEVHDGLENEDEADDREDAVGHDGVHVAAEVSCRPDFFHKEQTRGRRSTTTYEIMSLPQSS